VLQDKFEKYKKKPGILFRNLFLLSLPGIGVIFFAVLYKELYSFFSDALVGGNADGSIFFLVLILPIIYIGRILSLQRDLIKIIIADEYNWVYSPDKRRNRWMDLVRVYPELFKRGNRDQNFQDEFWGKFSGKRQMVDFWSGMFEYTTERGSGKHRSKSTYRKYVVALRLNKKLKSDFLLKPNSIEAWFLSFVRKNENINTESVDFNKCFSVFYNGNKIEKQLEIIKTLSPSVQEKILNMREEQGKFSLQFRGETVLFVFSGYLLRRMKTNFFLRGVRLDPRDAKTIQDRMNSILDISSEIVPFLD
jgi:phage pi2 protein 07